MNRALLLFAFLAFALVPVVVGTAETKTSDAAAEKSAQKPDQKSDQKTDVVAKSGDSTGEKAVEKSAEKKRMSNECLASEEVIQDLEAREKKLKEREEALNEKEKALSSQDAAVKEELAKLDSTRAEIQGVHAKSMAEREEKVNKLMETLETMSPKAAAAVLNGVDDELAVTALSRLTNVKAGKILSNLHPDKSARLSEIMAYGKATTGKEKAHAETERAPASKR